MGKHEHTMCSNPDNVSQKTEVLRKFERPSTCPTLERKRLTRVGADGEREDPEEEGECQRGTQQDHIGHHLGVLLHRDVVLRGHVDELRGRTHGQRS